MQKHQGEPTINTNKSANQLQDYNNQNYQELPLHTPKEQGEEFTKHPSINFTKITSYLQQKQVVNNIKRWVNLNWKKLQLLSIFLMLLVLTTAILIIYQSFKLSSLQSTQDNFSIKQVKPDYSRSRNNQLQIYNHLSTKTQAKPSEKIQLQQKQLKILKLQRNIIELNKKIRRQQKLHQKLSQIPQNIQRKQINNPTQIIDPHQDLKHIKNIVKGQVQPRFPKIVWMYFEQNIKAESNLTQTLVNNLQQYLVANGYQFYMITNDNFNFIMNNRNQEQLGFILADLWHKAYETNDSSNLPDHTLSIKKQLISLIMLSESGGILIDKEIILTEDLSWLQHLDRISYVNKGRSQTPNIVGFYYRNYTSWIQKVAMSEYEDREIHLYPSLDPYFLAVSKQGCQFIKLVLQKYYLLVQNYDKVKQLMHKYDIHMFQISGNDPYFQSYYIAFTMVLKQKQMEFDVKWLESYMQDLRELAIDYYGIYSINRLYGPLRYRLLFSDQSYEDIYYTFSKIQNSQLIRYYGDIKLMTFIPFQYRMAEYLEQAQSGNEKYAVLKNSFFHKYVYTNNNDAEFIIDSLPNLPQQIPSPITVIWKSLPKIIWIYLDENITQNIIQRLCLHNIKTAALQSGFQLNIITDANIEQYISKDNLDQIDQIAFSRYIDYPETRNELIQLTILKQYGGIWIELPLFTIQNLNWILHINKNQYVINKLGRLPKVLLFYHPIFSKFPWKVDNDSSLQLNQHLSYLKCFIAAQQNSELITLWLAQLTLNFKMQIFQLQQKFIVDYKVPSFDISKDQREIFKYSLISILANQNKKYNNHLNGKEVTMAEKCGLWILNGFIGSQKLKQFTNYQQGYDHNNSYLWSYSQNYVSSLLGQFHYFISLSQAKLNFLNYQLSIRQPDIPHIKIHSNSIFYNYLYNPKVIKQVLNNVTSEELKAIQQSKQHIPKDIWLYVENRSLQAQAYLKRCVNNILHYSRGYKIHQITNKNVKEFVTVQTRQRLQALLEEIDKLINYSPQNIYSIKKRIVILSILAEKGGIFIDNNVILTEPLDWIHTINKNVFVNGGYNTINKIIGFLSVNQHSQLNKHSQIQQISNPILQPFFIAALKNTTFINDLFNQYLATVRQDHIKLNNQLANHINYIKAVQQINLFYLASDLLLQAEYLDNKEHSMTDYYGLSLINSRYFPKKLDYIYSNLPISYLFNSMGIISEEQLIAYIGPLSYMIEIPKAQQIYNMIDFKKIKNNSLLSNHLFLHHQDKQVQHSFQSKININTVWQELPKIIWYYQTLALQQEYINSKIYVKVFQMANQAGFDIIQVSADNVTNYTNTNNNTYDIDQIIPKIKLDLDRQAIIQFINKIQLIDQYGGIIFPTNFIPTDNLNWIVNLGEINSDFIYNRYGKKPKILTFFRQTPHHFYNYTINQNLGIKTSSNITVLTDFIAAVNNTQFIQQLLSELIQLITMTQQQIKKISDQYHISLDTNKLELQQFVAFVVKFILNRKENQLNLQGSQINNFEYYGIWSINQDIGPNKWLPDLNGNSDTDQTIKLKLCFSANSDYVNKVVGRPNYFLSLTAENKLNLSSMIFDEQTRKLQLQRLYALQFKLKE